MQIGVKSGARTPQAGDLIAFYGTLMRGLGAMDELGVEDGLRYLGPCLCAGELHDLGAYPGLVPSRSKAGHVARVHGELFEILDERVTLALDAFEGFDPHAPDVSLYLREHIEMLEPAGERAWLYVYNQPLPNSDPHRSWIESGDWRVHTAKKTPPRTS